uniref:Uncharacterized protein n=1 Tax=Oryza meridionalis TaxID=40149 RepID=A0A0E0CJA1_9ORYZ
MYNACLWLVVSRLYVGAEPTSLQKNRKKLRAWARELRSHGSKPRVEGICDPVPCLTDRSPTRTLPNPHLTPSLSRPPLVHSTPWRRGGGGGDSGVGQGAGAARQGAQSASWPTEEEEEADDNSDVSGSKEGVKPPKKCRIEPCGDRSRHREVGETPPQLVGGRSDVASAPRTKRLLVPSLGMVRTMPLPDQKAPAGGGIDEGEKEMGLIMKGTKGNAFS